LSFLLLPGTVIHEVSHMLLAEMLGVKTGEFNFIPELIENKKIKVASLKLTKSDSFRQTIIGLAPIFSGLIIILGLNIFLKTPLFSIKFFHFLANNILKTAGFVYFTFIISNTMFSSKKDLENIFFPMLVLLIIIISLWLISFQVKIILPFSSFLTVLLEKLNFGLLKTIFINLLLLIIIRFSHFLFSAMIKS